MVDVFDTLQRLKDAAEACNGHAQEFIRLYSRLPELSTLGGVPYNVNSQLRNHLGSAEKQICDIGQAVKRWNEADPKGDALSYLERSVGTKQPPILIGGLSYLTAHEAARALAEALESNSWLILTDSLDIEDCRKWAEDVKKLETPDLYARIQAEYHEACKLIEQEQAPAQPLDLWGTSEN